MGKMSWNRRDRVKVNEALRCTDTVAVPICFASYNIHPMSKNNVVQSQELQTSSNQRANTKEFRISNVNFKCMIAESGQLAYDLSCCEPVLCCKPYLSCVVWCGLVDH